jgi:hypothetical protein
MHERLSPFKGYFNAINTSARNAGAGWLLTRVFVRFKRSGRRDDDGSEVQTKGEEG